MAKKEKVTQTTELEPVATTTSFAVEEPLFETEAYGTPQPDAGSDVTVMKPVGIGGPVPIVAPKHNTVQLQPIIVPLAVVPYMTQDSAVLRTDGRMQEAYAEADYVEATAFEDVGRQQKAAAKKNSVLARVFSLFTMLLSLVILVPFIIAIFKDSLFGETMNCFDLISATKGEIYWSIFRFVVMYGCAASAALLALTSLISLIAGRYFRAFNSIVSLAPLGAILAYMVNEIIDKRFVLANSKVVIALVAVCALNFLLTLIFSLVLNHAEDKNDKLQATNVI